MTLSLIASAVSAAVAVHEPGESLTPTGWVNQHLDEAARQRTQAITDDWLLGNHMSSLFGVASDRTDQSAGVTAPGFGPRIGPADWPGLPYPLPTISMRVRAVFVGDDNGSRRVQITPSQVLQWVNKANEILASAGIQLTFNPAFGSGDVEYLNSTLINNLESNTQANWSTMVAAANAVAAQTPERMTVFFRWGPNASPTGGGFSWTDLNFIGMPGFSGTTVCGVQNIGLFAHEIGHYLGLPHTFTGIYASVSAAQTAYINAGRDAAVFNNDGRDETEPDPFVNTSATQCSATSVTLDGTVFTLPRSNAMSYYHPISDFTPSQSATMRQVLLLRSRQSLTAALRGPALAPIEAEFRSWMRSTGTTGYQTMQGFLGRWSADTQQFWAGGPVGSTLQMSFPVARAGRYRVYGSFTAAPDFGIHHHTINGQAGTPLDLYANLVLPTGPVYLGAFNLAAGNNTWRTQVVGANPRSTGLKYAYGLDYILLELECAPDFNQDGFLTFEDFDAFVSAFEGGSPSADFNADGFLTFEDFDAFVAAFESGC